MRIKQALNATINYCKSPCSFYCGHRQHCNVHRREWKNGSGFFLLSCTEQVKENWHNRNKINSFFKISQAKKHREKNKNKILKRSGARKTAINVLRIMDLTYHSRNKKKMRDFSEIKGSRSRRKSPTEVCWKWGRFMVFVI